MVWDLLHLGTVALEALLSPSVMTGVAITQADLSAKGSCYSTILC